MAKSSIVRFFRYLQFQFTSRLQPAVASGRRGGAGVLLLLALSECSFWCSSGWCFMAFFWCCGVVLSLPRRTPEEGGAGILPLLASGFFEYSFWFVFLLRCSFWRSSGPDSGVLLVLVALLVLVLCYRATEKNPEARRTPEGTSEETAPPCPLLLTAVRQTEMNC